MNWKSVLASLAVFALLLVGTTQAGLLWTGGGDGVSVYQEANWQDTGTLLPPPAGSVDPNVAVNDTLIVNGGTPGGPAGAGNSSNHLVLGNSGAIEMTAGTFRLGAGAGIRRGTIDISGGALLAQFLADGFSGGTTNGPQTTLGGTGAITLYGGGTPINHGATIDFTSAAAQLNLLAETPAAFLSEHLGKIKVNSAPAADGINLSVVTDGGAGSIVTALIPAATLTWTGGGDGTSFEDGDNWSGASYPPGGTVPYNALVGHHIVNAPGTTIDANPPARIDIYGGSLRIQDGTVAVPNNKGITSTSAGAGNFGGEVIEVLGGELKSQWLQGVAVTLGGDGVITVNGGGSPIPGNTTIDLTSFDAEFRYNNRAPVAFGDHVGQFTVNGDPAVVGVNVQVTAFNGALGSVVTAIPEPSTLVLLLLGAVGTLIARRSGTRY